MPEAAEHKTPTRPSAIAPLFYDRARAVCRRSCDRRRHSGGGAVLLSVSVAQRHRRNVGRRPPPIERRDHRRHRKIARRGAQASAHQRPAADHLAAHGAARPRVDRPGVRRGACGRAPSSTSSGSGPRLAGDRADRWYVFDRASLVEPAGAVERRFRESPARVRRSSCRSCASSCASAGRSSPSGPTSTGVRSTCRCSCVSTRPSRDRFTSFLGFAVDVERLKSDAPPGAAGDQRWRRCSSPRGFPPLRVDAVRRRRTSIGLASTRRPRSSTKRTFPLVFFDKELLEYAAPYEEKRETFKLRTSYGPQSIEEIVSASTRPQMALMVVLALVMGGGVFFVAGAAAREVRVAELKSNFVASVSHDLKTPLALIQLFAETLELGRVRNAERAQEYYRVINGEARKLTRLIENILDFSKMEAGLRPYRVAPCDVGELTRAGASSRWGASSRRGIFTVRHVGRSVAAARARRLRCRRAGVGKRVDQRHQVLGRRPRASRSRSAGRTARVRERHRSRHRHLAPGTETDLPQVLSRQQRPERRSAGCGLGLAIVDHTMRGHGGFVNVESEPDRGSTFTLHFPIPAGASADGAVHEADSGDRGRAADVARPA